MAVGCLPLCAKYSLFIFNVIFFLGGGTVLGIGLWMVFDTAAIHTLLRVSGAIAGDDNSYAGHLQYELTPAVLQQTGYILIAAGAATVLFSFLGCCGAIKESQCCLSLYAICLMLVLGLEVSAGIYAAVAKTSFEENARNVMLRTLTDEYMNSSSNAITFAWNRMMAELECCGVVDFRDFNGAVSWKQQNTGRIIPVQCCKLKDKKSFIPIEESCTQNPNTRNSNMDTGCYESLKYVLRTHLTVLMAVGIGIGLSQLLGIILTFVLCCSVEPYK
ncbi:Tetraspanin [Chamberlinius hualienensis]